MLTLAQAWWLLLLPLPLVLRRLLPEHQESRVGLFVPSLERLARLTGNQPRSGAVVLRSSIFQRIAYQSSFSMASATVIMPSTVW